MRAVASRFQYPHHLTEPVSVLFSGIDFCGNSFGYSIAPAVVVEKVVSLDKRPDEKPVAGIAKFVSQKILETKPVSADFAKSFRMVDACVDVVLEDMLVPVCYQKRIFLRELRTVVCQQIVELERDEFMHSGGDGFGAFIVDYIGPCKPRVIVFHRQNRDAVEQRQIGLEKIVRVFPVEMLEFYFNFLRRFLQIVSQKYSANQGRTDLLIAAFEPELFIYEGGNRGLSKAGQLLH